MQLVSPWDAVWNNYKKGGDENDGRRIRAFGNQVALALDGLREPRGPGVLGGWLTSYSPKESAGP